MDISNPHDKFFKETFSNIENAADFFNETLPESLLKNIDFTKLNMIATLMSMKNLKNILLTLFIAAFINMIFR